VFAIPVDLELGQRQGQPNTNMAPRR
jgi:hypothetical protein